MTDLAECTFCQDYEFKKCGEAYPCERLISEIDVLGLVFKPNNNNDPITKNLEAKFFGLNLNSPHEFYHLAFNLSAKTKLVPITTFELNTLGRKTKDSKFKSVYLTDSDNRFVLVPENWAVEVRTILKYLLRLHTQDFDLPFNFIEKVALKVDPLKPLQYDKRKSTILI